jgi:hypothetical protein
MKKVKSELGKPYKRMAEIRTPPAPEPKQKRLNPLTCKDPFSAIEEKYSNKRRAVQ